jgi:hypothetical protein
VVNGDDHHGGRLDDIGQLTHPHREKLSLQVLYPLAGEERDSDKRTMGGNNLRSDMSEKIIAASPIPPPAARNRSIGWRTMAVVSTMSAPVYALQTLTELRYDVWREFDPDDTLRFYALRMGEVSLIKLSPQQIIANGTEWRFLNELKRELKT